MAHKTARQTRTDSAVTFVAHPSPTDLLTAEGPVGGRRLTLPQLQTPKIIENQDGNHLHTEDLKMTHPGGGRTVSRAHDDSNPISPLVDQPGIIVTKELQLSNTPRRCD
jgi:hypothetical protein